MGNLKNILRRTLGESYMDNLGIVAPEKKVNKYKKIVEEVKAKKAKRLIGENKKLVSAYENIRAYMVENNIKQKKK